MKFNRTQRVSLCLSCRIDYMAVIWLEPDMEYDALSSIYSSQRNDRLQNQAVWCAKWHSKVIYQAVTSKASTNSGHCCKFYDYLIHFLHLNYCSVFYLATFFILKTIGLTLINSLWSTQLVLQCIPPSCMPA